MGKVRVEFEDTGGGIKASPPAKVFQFAFTTKANGTGLGLCQAARAVADHTGTISVENGPLGARFIIMLPFAPRIGESMQDIGLKIDLSEDISDLTFAASALETSNSETDHSL